MTGRTRYCKAYANRCKAALNGYPARYEAGSGAPACAGFPCGIRAKAVHRWAVRLFEVRAALQRSARAMTRA
jgi:hypothetical protein